MSYQINYKQFKEDGQGAEDVLKCLEQYSKNRKGSSFKKDAAVRYVEEILGENKGFIEVCINQLKKDGTLYEPDHVLQFAKPLRKV